MDFICRSRFCLFTGLDFVFLMPVGWAARTCGFVVLRAGEDARALDLEGPLRSTEGEARRAARE